ncbi:hypothetical protein QJQ45_006688 [Haematococcus lacustris]|nr:hypothetical protein QJQ45_006688 [Haematococcus lacustris]
MPPRKPTKGKGKAKGKAAKAKPAPQPGRWVDRDCNAALNMQRIGESKWRPLELCYWPDQGALPAKGKEYPGLGYKRLRDKPPKVYLTKWHAGGQPCEAELDRSKPTRRKRWKPQPGQVQDRLLLSAWSKRFEAPVRGVMWCPKLDQATPGDVGRWVDRDCNAALNIQRAGESKRQRYVKLYAKAARAQLGWSGEKAQLFIKLACGYSLNTDSPELQTAHLDKAHVNDLIEEAAKQRRLLALEEGDSLQDTVPLPCRMRHAVHVCRCLEQWQQPPTVPLRGQPKRGGRRVGPRVLTCPPPFTLTPLARAGVHFVKVDSRVLHGVCQQLGLTRETGKVFTAEPARSHHWDRWFSTGKLATLGLPCVGKGLAEQREFVFNPATQIGVSAASGVWDPTTGQLLADQLLRWKLTKGQVEHGSGLNNARRDTERWLAPIKPHLQHLAAASSAGTSLEANLKHITVTLATWDAVWEVYLDPKWAKQRLRLYGAQDRTLEQFFKKLEVDMAEVSMERHGRAKQLVVFFGAAGTGTRGGWGADAVLRACCKVVCRPRGTDQRRGRVVLVDEHRTSRVSSAVNGQQPCERQLNKRRATRPAGWKPPAGQVEPRLLRPAWSQQRDQPVRGMMWCPVVAPRKPPQAPRSSQAATQAAASEPGPSTPLPAKRSKRTKAE